MRRDAMLGFLLLALHAQAAILPRQASTDAASSLTVTTATPAPTAAASSTLPSQAPLPPKQAWCPSEIFCAGSLLQTVNIARPYADSKTIVDKPTAKSSNATLADFNTLAAPGLTSITVGQIVNFLESDFQGEGQELQALTLNDFVDSPSFLNGVKDPLVKSFSHIVHGYWSTLIRGTNESTLCTGGKCESTLIPLNHTFVVPGGRFREQYYWDSYFIVQGLLASELNDVVNSTLQNFMDELDRFGFIPNGGRIYYLNRSQPPFFIPMLFSYVNATGDTDILRRALPLAEKELKWWSDNRSVKVAGSNNVTHTLMHYSVTNTAPRPESYLEDYQTANGADLQTPFTDDQKGAIYAELASGAETGWDYSSRWMRTPFLGNESFQFPALRSLNVRATIPVDLNSILYAAHTDLVQLYTRVGNSAAATRHRTAAATLRTAIIDVFWDPTKFAFYDYNVTASARSTQFTAAHWYALWVGIHPPELLENPQNAFAAFSSLNFVLNRYNGTLPATFLTTGQQWDAPNAWPPHQWIAVEALRALPANLTSGALPTASDSFSLIPSGQLGADPSQLPVQNIAGGGDVPSGTDINRANGTVLNGGAPKDGEGWAASLARQLANRYVASVFCSWHATGGSIPGLVDRLPDAELNVTAAIGLQGQMFEKFSVVDIDSAGRGGEYTVQAGFGWTNGVLLHFAQTFGDELVAPDCPLLVAPGTGGSGGGTGAAGRVRVGGAAVWGALALVGALLLA